MTTNTQQVEQCHICSKVSRVGFLIPIPEGKPDGPMVFVCAHHQGVSGEVWAQRDHQAERAWEHEIVVAEVDAHE